jgi:hypothetical protein
MRDTVDHGASFAVLDTKELVRIGVALPPDFGPWINRHQNQLKLGSGIKHSPEVSVFFSQFLDISKVSNHDTPPKGCATQCGDELRLSRNRPPRTDQG